MSLLVSSIEQAVGQSARQRTILCNLEELGFESLEHFIEKMPDFIGHFGDNVCAIKCEIDYERHLNLVSHP